jgi:hypothetical protein
MHMNRRYLVYFAMFRASLAAMSISHGFAHSRFTIARVTLFPSTTPGAQRRRRARRQNHLDRPATSNGFRRRDSRL